LLDDAKELKFTDTIVPGNTYAYFITAVDVVGKESGASNAADTDGSFIDSILLPVPSTLPGHEGGGNTGNTGNTGNGTGTNGDNGGATGYGSEASKAVPAAPAGVSVEPNGVSVLIKWTPNAAKDTVKEYNIYFSDTANGAYKKIGSVAGPQAKEYFYIGAVFNGFYRVTAVNAAGESPPSGSVQFK
jgi:penicillin-binding protein 1B